MQLGYCAFHPVVLALKRNEVNVKVYPCIERLGVRPPGAIDEVACVRHVEAVVSEQLLVDLHLALVARLPGLVQRVDRFLLCRGLVVDDDVLAVAVDPQVDL